VAGCFTVISILMFMMIVFAGCSIAVFVLVFCFVWLPERNIFGVLLFCELRSSHIFQTAVKFFSSYLSENIFVLLLQLNNLIIFVFLYRNYLYVFCYCYIMFVFPKILIVLDFASPTRATF